MISLDSDSRSRLLAVVAVVALVATAGCAGLGSPDQTDETTPETDSPDDQTDEATNETDNSDTDESENSTDDESSSSGPETNLGEFGDLDPAETDQSAAQLLAESADRLAAAETYSIDQQVVNVREQNNQSQTIRLDQSARVDRPARRIAAEGTTETESQSVSIQRYLLNGSLYESSEQIAQQFGSEWVKTNVSEQFDRIFEQFDSANQAEPLFRNATGTVEGQTTIDGQRVYAINATVENSAVVETRSNIVGVERFRLTVWVAADSSLPLRIGEDSTLTLSTAFGEITQRTDSVIDYRFGPVDITLPEEAEDAPLASEVTNQ
jgi:hypothetical protein